METITAVLVDMVLVGVFLLTCVLVAGTVWEFFGMKPQPTPDLIDWSLLESVDGKLALYLEGNRKLTELLQETLKVLDEDDPDTDLDDDFDDGFDDDEDEWDDDEDDWDDDFEDEEEFDALSPAPALTHPAQTLTMDDLKGAVWAGPKVETPFIPVQWNPETQFHADPIRQWAEYLQEREGKDVATG
jgi:hypothetical protein